MLRGKSTKQVHRIKPAKVRFQDVGASSKVNSWISDQTSHSLDSGSPPSKMKPNVAARSNMWSKIDNYFTIDHNNSSSLLPKVQSSKVDCANPSVSPKPLSAASPIEAADKDMEVSVSSSASNILAASITPATHVTAIAIDNLCHHIVTTLSPIACHKFNSSATNLTSRSLKMQSWTPFAIRCLSPRTFLIKEILVQSS